VLAAVGQAVDALSSSTACSVALADLHAAVAAAARAPTENVSKPLWPGLSFSYDTLRCDMPLC